ncbi:MAG: hypothetical protein RR192_02415, partial [Peptostreptococcaceae bacterium]
VVSYNKIHNVADVFISNLKDKEGYTLKDVPIQLAGSGIHASALREHDNVYIQFNNGSLFQAKIVGKADEVYATSTRKKERHIRKGSLIVSQEKINGDVKASSDTWVDDSNKNPHKHLTYRDFSPINRISEMMSSKGNFNGEEVGLYNPTSSSIVKILDNGIIDMFVSTNVGVRINPKNRTIEILGNVSAKSDNWSVLSNNIELKSKGKISFCAEAIELNSNKITKNGVEISV